MKHDGYKYYISVVIPVYNTEEYLDETIQSVIGQSIGFEDNIQLILVNNASEDNSEEICRRYLEKYPDNVVYHKLEVNNGPCPARNAGMLLAEGKYINFLDSDDKWERTSFEKACTFFDEHYDEIDMVSCRIRHFDASDNWHGLDWKFSFDEEAKIIDIRKDYQYVQLHAGASIIKTSAAKKHTFDDRLRHAEDAKYITEILLDNYKYALIRNAEFYYRTRSSGNSVLQSVLRSRSWYIDTPVHVFEYLNEQSIKKTGCVLKYIQYFVMYELQWRLGSPLTDVLSPEEKDKYSEQIRSLLKVIDDQIILEQKSLEPEYKTFAISVKHNAEGTGSGEDHQETGLSDQKTFYHFVHKDTENGSLILEGSHLIMTGTGMLDLTPVLLAGDDVIVCERTEIPHHAVYSLGEVIADHLGFKAVIRLSDSPVKICPALMKRDGTIVRRENIICGKFFPVSHVYENGYAVVSGCMLKWEDGLLQIIPKVSRKVKNAQERRFTSEIWKKALLGGRKAVLGRFAYRILKCFKRKELWIISDRILRADDSGEAFFLYLQNNPVRGVRTVFAISKQSPDYQRLKRIGKCVDAMSFRHKMLHLLCDVNISSQADEISINPYAEHDDALRDLLVHQRYVFLQHGIIKDDMSVYLNRFEKNASGFVTSSQREYESIYKGKYGYAQENVWLTGLPRYDRLYNDAKKTILVMPTWRQNLMAGVDPGTGLWCARNDIKDSDYYRFYHGLLTSDRLITGLEQLGYDLQFYPHPVMRQSRTDFEADSRVVIVPGETNYRDLFASGSLLVTDYSSVAFDFAYLHKPVIYCQFDKEAFFNSHMYSKGYFDYETDGLGEVIYDLESTIDKILEYAQTGCQLKDKYTDRINAVFAFTDDGNCRRVLNKILEAKR